MSYTNNSTPLVSVIVPVYNVLPYLPKCVESLLAQTYECFELILVDDGSTDGSGEYCDQCATDQRVQVIHQTNAGLSAARNAGLKVAQGEYIAFIDGDDYFHPQMIEVLVRAALDNHCEMSMCGYARVEEQAPTPEYHLHDVADLVNGHLSILERDNLYAGMFSLGYLSFFSYMVVWNKLYSRKLIGDTRFEDGSLEDGCFHSAVFKGCDKAAVVDVPLYYYLVRASSISHSQKTITLDDLPKLYRIYNETLKDQPRHAAYCLAFLYKRFVYAMWCYRGTEYESRLRELYHEVKRNTLSLYLKDRHTPWTQKAYFLLFWYCPWIYTFCSERLLPLIQRLRGRD